MTDALGIVVPLFFLLFAVLSLVRFDSTFLWKLTIPATEAGHVLAVAAAGWMIWNIMHGWSGLPAAIVTGTAAWVLLRPLRIAGRIARTLPGRLHRSFGPADPGRDPFSHMHLFLPTARSAAPERVYARSYDDRELRIDLYRPTGVARHPLVVVIHGGGWNNGDPGQLPGLNHELRRSGYNVASVSYALVPAHRWPQQRDDVIACIRHLHRNAASLSIDPDRIVLLGRSAGAQLATHVAYSDLQMGIRGVISLYGPQDLIFAHRNAPPDDLIHSRRLLEEYLGGTPERCPEQYKDASPYFSVNEHVPPTLLIHGKHDLLTWHLQSSRLHKVLDTAGVRSMYLPFPWATHAFDFFLNGPAGQLSVYAILWFLQSCTRSSDA